MEIFQPFGSEAWPSSQRDGVCQGQEVVVEGSAWSADGEGTIVVAQRLDLRGKWSMRPAARAGPWRRPQWRPSLVQPKCLNYRILSRHKVALLVFKQKITRGSLEEGYPGGQDGELQTLPPPPSQTHRALLPLS